jgi:hypothetical protein
MLMKNLIKNLMKNRTNISLNFILLLIYDVKYKALKVTLRGPRVLNSSTDPYHRWKQEQFNVGNASRVHITNPYIDQFLEIKPPRLNQKIYRAPVSRQRFVSFAQVLDQRNNLYFHPGEDEDTSLSLS